jgi:hypothetical protein
MVQRIQARMAHIRMDMEQQPLEYKMTLSIKSQDATSHQDDKNTNRLITVS